MMKSTPNPECSFGTHTVCVQQQAKVWTHFLIQLNGKVCPNVLTGAVHATISTAKFKGAAELEEKCDVQN